MRIFRRIENHRNYRRLIVFIRIAERQELRHAWQKNFIVRPWNTVTKKFAQFLVFEFLPMTQFFHSRKFVDFQTSIFERDYSCLVINDVSDIRAEETPVLHSAIGDIDPVSIWR